MKLWRIVLAGLLPAYCGCGFTGVTELNGFTYPEINTFAYYHAYGDSITYGFSLPAREFEAYPFLIAAYNKVQLKDYGIPGDQSCDLAPRQIMPNKDAPNLQTKGLYTVLIGTNDVDLYGPGPYESVFNLCQQAAISWLAVPAESKVLATSPQVKTSGATHLETGWSALTTDAVGASISFPISLAARAPIYLWYRITDGNVGAFSYSLDGTVLGTLKSESIPDIRTENGSISSLAFIRLPSVASGAHTLSITQTNGGSSGAGVVAIGVPPPTSNPAFPHILVGTLPPQYADGAGIIGACTVIVTPCALYTADITANVVLFQQDNLNVQLFSTGKYMTGTASDMADKLHPNVTGQLEIFRALEDVLAL